LNIHVNISLLILPFMLGFPSCFFPSGPTNKTPYAPLLPHIHAACPCHLFPYWITHIIFGEEQKV
jgi:hypothetical protein